MLFERKHIFPFSFYFHSRRQLKSFRRRRRRTMISTIKKKLSVQERENICLNWILKIIILNYEKHISEINCVFANVWSHWERERERYVRHLHQEKSTIVDTRKEKNKAHQKLAVTSMQWAMMCLYWNFRIRSVSL